jgi:Predicted Zn-dependent peptidases
MTTESAHGVSRTVLPGGLRVVTESLPAVRSVALGIWVGVGSRDEDQAHAGATHYLEHLLFKGTRRRTALEISAEMDAAGGEMNASPRRSTPATTRGCSTRTFRWPLTSCPTW